MTLWLYPWQMAEVRNKQLQFHCKEKPGCKNRTPKDTTGIQSKLWLHSAFFFFSISAPQLCQHNYQSGMQKIFLLLTSAFFLFPVFMKPHSQYFTLPDHLNFYIRCSLLLSVWWEHVCECCFNLKGLSQVC